VKNQQTTKHDPLQIFIKANGYSNAYDILSDIKDREMMKTIAQPAMVFAAFASELFLKCIASIEVASVPHGHDLKKLFDSLSAERRQRITVLWDRSVSLRADFLQHIEQQTGIPIPRDIDSALNNGREAFKLLRYSYEKREKDVEFSLSDLPIVLLMAVLEIKPEWKAASLRYQRVTSSLGHPKKLGE